MRIPSELNRDLFVRIDSEGFIHKVNCEVTTKQITKLNLLIARASSQASAQKSFSDMFNNLLPFQIFVTASYS